jgi:hypothetical protein
MSARKHRICLWHFTGQSLWSVHQITSLSPVISAKEQMKSGLTAPGASAAQIMYLSLAGMSPPVLYSKGNVSLYSKKKA